ncbi:MAG: hypothetical protein AAF621_03160 [Pseudomonadota bacterium]
MKQIIRDMTPDDIEAVIPLLQASAEEIEHIDISKLNFYEKNYNDQLEILRGETFEVTDNESLKKQALQKILAVCCSALILDIARERAAPAADTFQPNTGRGGGSPTPLTEYQQRVIDRICKATSLTPEDLHGIVKEITEEKAAYENKLIEERVDKLSKEESEALRVFIDRRDNEIRLGIDRLRYRLGKYGHMSTDYNKYMLIEKVCDLYYCICTRDAALEIQNSASEEKHGSSEPLSAHQKGVISLICSQAHIQAQDLNINEIKDEDIQRIKATCRDEGAEVINTPNKSLDVFIKDIEEKIRAKNSECAKLILENKKIPKADVLTLYSLLLKQQIALGEKLSEFKKNLEVFIDNIDGFIEQFAPQNEGLVSLRDDHKKQMKDIVKRMTFDGMECAIDSVFKHHLILNPCSYVYPRFRIDPKVTKKDFIDQVKGILKPNFFARQDEDLPLYRMTMLYYTKLRIDADAANASAAPVEPTS